MKKSISLAAIVVAGLVGAATLRVVTMADAAPNILDEGAAESTMSAKASDFVETPDTAQTSSRQISSGQAASKTSLSPEDEDAVRALVRETLLDNPEILFEAFDIFWSRQHMAAFDTLFDESKGVIIGNPDTAKVAIVELFDYHCSACKQATDYVAGLARERDDVVLAFREYPILRQESLRAAELAFAAGKQGKYLDYHIALMQARGTVTEDRALKIAADLGMDTEKLKADADSDATGKAILETVNAAREAGFDGTPTFLVASLDGSFLEVLSGYNPAGLEETLRQAASGAGSTAETAN